MSMISGGGRAATLVAAGALAAGLLTACGGNGSGPGASGSGASAGEGGSVSASPGGDVSAVRTAYRKTVDAGTARMTLTTTTGGAGTGTAVSGSGVIDLAGGNSDLTIGAQGQRIEERTLDKVLYEKVPRSAGMKLPAGKTWISVDLRKAASELGVAGTDAQPADPAEPFGYVKGLTGKNVTKVGTETVDSTATTHYTLSVDVSALAQGDSKEAQQLRQQLGGTIPVDLWLDGQGRVRQERVRITVRAGAGATAPSPSADPQPSNTTMVHESTVVTTLRFSDFGTHVSVARPPAAQTVDVTGRLADLGGKGATTS